MSASFTPPRGRSPSPSSRMRSPEASVINQARDLLDSLRVKARNSPASNRAQIETLAHKVENSINYLEGRASGNGSPTFGRSPQARSRSASPPTQRRSSRSRSPIRDTIVAGAQNAQEGCIRGFGPAARELINEMAPYLCVCAITAMIAHSNLPDPMLAIAAFSVVMACTQFVAGLVFNLFVAPSMSKVSDALQVRAWGAAGKRAWITVGIAMAWGVLCCCGLLALEQPVFWLLGLVSSIGGGGGNLWPTLTVAANLTASTNLSPMQSQALGAAQGRHLLMSLPKVQGILGPASAGAVNSNPFPSKASPAPAAPVPPRGDPFPPWNPPSPAPPPNPAPSPPTPNPDPFPPGPVPPSPGPGPGPAPLPPTPSSNSDVATLASPFFLARSIAVPFILTFRVFLGMLTSVNSPGVLTAFNVGAALLEACGAFVVLSMGYGLQGVGIACVVVYVVMFCAGLFLMQHMVPKQASAYFSLSAAMSSLCACFGERNAGNQNRAALLGDNRSPTNMGFADSMWGSVRDAVRDGTGSKSMQFFCLHGPVFVVTILSARLGKEALVTNHVALLVWSFSSVIIDGVAAGTPIQLWYNPMHKRSIAVGVAFGCVCAVMFFFCQDLILRLLLRVTTTGVAIAFSNLWIVLCIFQVVNSIAHTLDRVLQSSFEFVYTQRVLLVCFVLFLPSSIVGYMVMKTILGAWIGLIVFNSCRAIAGMYKVYKM